jgi:hypothetical protein
MDIKAYLSETKSTTELESDSKQEGKVLDYAFIIHFYLSASKYFHNYWKVHVTIIYSLIHSHLQHTCPLPDLYIHWGESNK